MTIKINKNFVKFLLSTIGLIIDSSLLLITKDDVFLNLFYIIANICFVTSICFKMKVEDCVVTSILYMLIYTLCIDYYIHYFNKYVFFEAQFIFVVPLTISCLKIKNENAKLFSIISVTYLIFNAFIVLLSNKVSFFNYISFIINIITFLGFYYVFSNLKIGQVIKDLYKYLFILSFALTIIQTAVGFNEDTRNGIFSVFGWGAYTFFIMIFFMYNLKLFIDGKINIKKLFVVILVTCLLYICTESKAALVFVFINIVLSLLVNKKITYTQLVFAVIGIMLIPISYKVLIHFTPKFAYLNNINNIVRYFIGNNNTRYEYGRFEALSNVFKNNDNFKKLIGVGFGSSCPLYKVFFEELGRDLRYPYYITKYGYKYGFQHTSAAILILDGGVFLFGVVVLFILKKFINTINNIRKNRENILDFIRFGCMIYLMYYFSYANVLKDFRIMGVLGILLGMKYLKIGKEEKNDKNYHSIQ